MNSPCMEGGNARQIYPVVFSDTKARRYEKGTRRHYSVQTPGKKVRISLYLGYTGISGETWRS